jgi:hypothetical protein
VGLTVDDWAFFPGQVAQIDYTLEHAECLASAPRADVFYAFSCDEPCSIAEVAAGLGKSANATTYHVNALVEVGLLIAAGERRRRSRTEKLYVHAARLFVSQGATGSKEYREKAVEAFAATARSMIRQREAVNETFDFDAAFVPFVMLGRFSQRASPERAKEFADRMVNLLREFSREAPDPDGVRINFLFNMSPTVGESRQALAKYKKKS